MSCVVIPCLQNITLDMMSETKRQRDFFILDLPRELLNHIISYLDFKSILTLRLSSPNQIAQVISLPELMIIKTDRENLLLQVEEAVEEAAQDEANYHRSFPDSKQRQEPIFVLFYKEKWISGSVVKDISTKFLPDWTDPNSYILVVAPCYRCFAWRAGGYFSDCNALTRPKYKHLGVDTSVKTVQFRIHDSPWTTLTEQVSAPVRIQPLLPPTAQTFHSWSRICTKNTDPAEYNHLHHTRMPQPKARLCIPCAFRSDPWYFRHGERFTDNEWSVCRCGALCFGLRPRISTNKDSHEPVWTPLHERMKNPRFWLCHKWCDKCKAIPGRMLKNWLLHRHSKRWGATQRASELKKLNLDRYLSTRTDEYRQTFELRKSEALKKGTWKGSWFLVGEGNWCPITEMHGSYCNCHEWYDEEKFLSWEKEGRPLRGRSWPPFRHPSLVYGGFKWTADKVVTATTQEDEPTIEKL